jgi:hypothetical protein
MLELAAPRPSLAQPLRRAEARLDGKTLALRVTPDFVAFATLHADDYVALAKKAAGHAVKVTIEAGAAAEVAPPAEPSEEEIKQQQLREEPAVQEALDLFDGRVVDVREAQPPGEDA